MHDNLLIIVPPSFNHCVLPEKMSEETEGPNWLKELEAKREHRLKARLGHEAGAGAPCLTCDEKCPGKQKKRYFTVAQSLRLFVLGLDLHFWRKICKNCKCAKENHDVHDDDIYGWAQFQLLGSKPNKSRRFSKFKIFSHFDNTNCVILELPDRKEVILEWTPKGHNETVDKFLKNLPPELLPVRGSAAAQERKQLLQKQIPIHDIDPTLCHELTEAELLKMNEYIAHVKQSSVGMGLVVQLGLNRSSTHTMGLTEPQILANRFPAQLSNTQPVQLQAGKLSEKLQNLNLEERKALNISEDLQIGLKPNQILDVNYPTYDRVKTPDLYLNYEVERANSPSFAERLRAQSPQARSAPQHHYQPNTETTANSPDNSTKNLPHYAPGTINRHTETKTPQKIASVRDLAFSTYDPNSLQNNFAATPNRNYSINEDLQQNKNLPVNYPNQLNNVPQDLQQPTQVNIGAINDITYPSTAVKLAEQHSNAIFEPPQAIYQPPNTKTSQCCHRCKKPFEDDAIVIAIKHSTALFHSTCFKCKGCNQTLADLMYFYHKESDDVYCGRDYAKIRGIPRCKACDELIFVKEYCLAENSTFHVKHFCCFECDSPLAGQNYVMEDAQPVCLPCFELIKANKCSSCLKVIKPDEIGAKLDDVHFHVNDECFACMVCKIGLSGRKLLFKNKRLYCSAVCYGADAK